MSKEEIINAIDEYTVKHCSFDIAYDRESFTKGFLVALLRSYEITADEYDDLEKELL